MSNTIRIKRTTGSTVPTTGSPVFLKNAELAFVEGTETLYIGKGTSGEVAQNVVPIAGSGAFVTLGTAQTISGAKTFTGGLDVALTSSVNIYGITSFFHNVSFDAGKTISLGTNRLQNVGDPTQAQDAVTRNYAESNFLRTGNFNQTVQGTKTFSGTLSVPSGGTLSVGGNLSLPSGGNLDVNETATVNIYGVAHFFHDVSFDYGTSGRLIDFDGNRLRYVGDPIQAQDAATKAYVDGRRLDQLVAPEAGVNMNSKRLMALADPADPNDAVHKAYVDNAVQGLSAKDSCLIASTNVIPAPASYNPTGGLQSTGQITGAPLNKSSVDSGATGTFATGDRILLKNQSTGSQNGIWVVTSPGSGSNGTWDRAPDLNQDSDATRMPFVFVEEGTSNNMGFVLSNDGPVVIGGASGSALTWTQFSGAGQITAGNGLTKTGNQLDVGGTTDRITVADESIDIASTYVGQTSITTLGTISTGTWSGTAIAANKGGTGQTVYTVGDLLYASSTSALSKLAAPLAGYVLCSNQSAGPTPAAPLWGKVDLTMHTTGVLAASMGGTGLTSLTSKGILYGNGTSAVGVTAAGTSGQALISNGASAPTWATLDLSYLPNSSYKESCTVATTSNITLTGSKTIDGIAVTNGMRVLVWKQSSPAENGIYVANTSGAWSRATDADTASKYAGATVTIDRGATYGGQLFSNGFLDTDTIGTTLHAWYRVLTDQHVGVTGGVQPWDELLAAIDGLTTTGFIARIGAGTAQTRAIATSGTGISVSNGDGVSGDPTLSLSTALSTIGGLTPAADRLAYYTSSNAAALATFTTFARSLLDDTSASDGRSTLGLGSIATQSASSVAITGGSITNLTTFDGITIDGGS